MINISSGPPCLVRDGFLARRAPDVAAGMPGMIPGGVSVRDFSAATGLGADASAEILGGLAAAGIGRRRGGQYFFEDGDRLRAAIELLKCGAPAGSVSEAIDWRDFEGLVAGMLSSMGFAVMRNLVLTRPRMEIDVVGVRLGVAMLIDCKHWRRSGRPALSAAVRKQIGRTRHYVAKTRGAVAVPVIVTLHQDGVDFVDRVPIVPVDRFPSFVDEFYGNLDGLLTVEGPPGP